jgi:hypothetical protein
LTRTLPRNWSRWRGSTTRTSRPIAEIVQSVPVSEVSVGWHDEVLEPDANLLPVRLRIYQADVRGNGAGVMHIHSGGRVELHLYPGTYHGSFKYPGASVSQRAEAQRLAFLTRVLAL